MLLPSKPQESRRHNSVARAPAALPSQEAAAAPERRDGGRDSAGLQNRPQTTLSIRGGRGDRVRVLEDVYFKRWQGRRLFASLGVFLLLVKQRRRRVCKTSFGAVQPEFKS